MSDAGSATPERDDIVTIRVRRVHLQLGAVLLVGFVMGYGTASARSERVRAQPASRIATDAASQTPGPIPVDVAGRPARGSAQAPVTLVEFTDYQCPYCARHFRDTYEALVAANEGKLRYVVRSFPVPSLHADAQKAAEAAECAFQQGKFWAYHRALFERSPRLKPDTLTQIAKRLGLRMTEFTACMRSERTAAAVMKDVRDGRRYGVIGTPTFFINGTALVGAQPTAAFQAEIDRAIRQRR